jgi:hypothetical protein
MEKNWLTDQDLGAQESFRKVKKEQLCEAVRENPFSTARRLSRNLPNEPSRWTVNRYLLSRGLQSYVPAFKTNLTAEQRRNRLRWAREFRDWDVDMWRRVLFTDETMIDLGSGPLRIRVRRPEGERNNPRFIQATRNAYRGGFSILFWGGIRFGKMTLLYSLPKPVTGQVYADFLQDTLLPDLEELIDDGFIFQDDNARPHRTRTVEEVKNNNNVDCLAWWPAASADLNPIENVWGILKERIRNRYPTRENLERIAIEEWYGIDWDIVNSCIDSMPNRVRLVIRARGGPIKY